MKLSEITMEDVVDYIHVDEDDYTPRNIEAIMTAAKQYILNYTGLTEEEAEEKGDFYIAFMALCQDMHDNRSMYVDKNNTNKVVESILGMHCVNFL